MMFTVIMPVYNNEATLERCFESILSQTYPDWEIIVVNDGSTDGTEIILRKYAFMDARIHILEQDNKGPGEARNLGMQMAKGDYITFIDGDDKWESDNCLARIHDVILKEHPAIIGTLVSIQDMHGKKRKHNIHREYVDVDMQANRSGKWIAFAEEQNCYCFWSYIYSRVFLEKERIRFPDFRRFQDPIFLSQALHAAQKYYLLPIEFYCNIWHEAGRLNGKQRQDLYRAQNWMMIFAKCHGYEKIIASLKQREVPVTAENAADLYLREEWLNVGHNGNLCEITTQYLYDFWQEKYKAVFCYECMAADQIVIYGAGGKGKEVLAYLKRYIPECLPRTIFAITGNPEEAVVDEVIVKNIYDITDGNLKHLIIVARQKEYQSEMINTVKQLGYQEYYRWSDELGPLWERMK